MTFVYACFETRLEQTATSQHNVTYSNGRTVGFACALYCECENRMQFDMTHVLLRVIIKSYIISCINDLQSLAKIQHKRFESEAKSLKTET